VDLAIDTHSPEPSYLQLARILRQAIESGEIGPREPLPSITYLVQSTGLAVGTVRKAVGVVAAEGLAYVVPGRGTFATPEDQRQR
jgi:DNA-binding GntR family transcriptional regulator